MNIQYIIVDDEPIAHRVIEKYCKDLPYMHLKANCYDALQALDFLNREKVDIIFLDINMPKLKGFDFLRTIDNPPQVIVTSAYKEYALEGFELNICDYLLKPFGFERFIKALNKAIGSLSTSKEKSTIVAQNTNDETIFIKGEKKYHQVRLDDILYIEACGNYSNIFLRNEQIITQVKISDFEKMLGTEKFVRVHKSFIVSVSKIKVIEGNQIRLGVKNIPIGRVYKINVDRLLKDDTR
jgi:DNA-binding LytR/AlgR family response regulator